jgi:predicted dehydrogenase
MTEGAGARSIFIVGAGQLGSRHLQALKAVDEPLAITVIDPAAAALATARERYEAVPGGSGHRVRFLQEIPDAFAPVDLAIVASNADARRAIVQRLLERGPVRCLILEKLLFDRREDYDEVPPLLRRAGVTTWVNCSMRTMPFYAAARVDFAAGPLLYTVAGSRFGLITNVIHYLDHIAYLTGELRFTLDTAGLLLPPVASKRPGFLELDGTLTARFANGCTGVFTCFPGGGLPVVVEICSPERRLICREGEGKAWVATAAAQWAWQELDAAIPYQSQMTAQVVRDILATGACDLVGLDDSVRLHLQLLEPLQQFLVAKGGAAGGRYPFT